MIYLTVQNTSRSLGSVDNKVQEADRLRNITANLREQLKQNMSALEEKLKRAKEYVAKVKVFLTFEYLDGKFFQKHNVHELTPVLFCFVFLTPTGFIQSGTGGLFSQSSVRQVHSHFGCYQFFPAVTASCRNILDLW